MDPTQIYGITAGGILLALLSYRISSIMSHWIQDRTFFLMLKYLVYPFLFRRRTFLQPFSRWRLLLLTLYWSATTACNLIGVRSLTEAGTRAGVLSTLHMIPLMFSSRLSFVADLLGLSLHTFHALHGSIGFMAVVQALIHVLVFLLHNALRLRDPLHFYGFLASIAMFCLLLLTWVRSPLYEFFLKSHFLLAILTMVALWRHLTIKPTFTRFYVIIGTSIFVATTLLRYGRLLFRQSSWSRPYATSRVVQVHKANGAICLEIDVRRPWNVRAGQYIYIWMPFCSFWSLFQSHPFMITWWNQDSHDRTGKIYLLIKPRYGFTRKLLRHLNAPALRTWVDGPYGKAENFGDFGSILMFASGIGIAAQVPYIKELLADIKRFKVRTRSMLLVWQLDNESDQEWVQEWMDYLLNEDKGQYILRITLYVLHGFESAETSYGASQEYGQHSSIRKYYGKPHLEKLIEREIVDRRGQLLVTTSVESDMQDQIQALVTRHLSRDVRLVHLAFRPREHQGFWTPKRLEVRHQGLV